MKLINLNPGRRKFRTEPDKRITITKTIVIVEYKGDIDLIISLDDVRAKQILKTVSL